MNKEENKKSNWTIIKDLGTRVSGTHFDKRDGKKRDRYRHFVLVRCKCGNEKELELSSLTRKISTQCNTCKMTRHDLWGTGAYRSWAHMIQRCTNPNQTGYKNYGGRGIKVCKRWLHSFKNFYKDMGVRPKGCSIDRINNEGNYTPANCRWATKSQQNLNKRRKKIN